MSAALALNSNVKESAALSAAFAVSQAAMTLLPKSLREVHELAQVAAATGLCRVRSVEDAMQRILTGLELGLTPMQSIRALMTVDGATCMRADAMAGLVMSKGLCEYFVCTHSDDKSATYETKRVGNPKPQTFTYSFSEAEAAGLTGKDNWRKFRRDMLRARAKATLARDVYPDVLNGMYDPDEIVVATGTSRAVDVERLPSETATITRAIDPVVDVAATDNAVAVTAPDLGEAQRIIERLKAASTREELMEVAESIKAKGLGGDKRIRAEYSAAKKRIDAQPVEANPEDDGR